MYSTICIGLIGAGLFAASPPQHTLERYEFLQIRMGVPFKIALYAPDEDTANKAADAAYARIRQLDQIMSDYDPDSELMQLCQSAQPGKPVPVSPDLQKVLCRSLNLSHQTRGAFDVTVGPVVELWRKARRYKQLPDADELKKACSLVDYRLVCLDKKAGTVELRKPGMRLDLGGIAKGYAAQQALIELKKHGISRALIDGSGDIVVGDPPPGRDHWRIGVASLTKPDEDPTRFLHLKNASVATSGDAYNYLEIDGKRYSHIVNPHTGIGLTNRSTVTVVAPNGAHADSLASAVSVLGPQRGLKLIEKLACVEALVVTLEGEEKTTYSSSRWKKLQADQDR